MSDGSSVNVIVNGKADFKNPVVIGGFVGQTPLGVTTTSYIVESCQMHQIAMVKSHHIPPVTVFVGGKMRNPFRIYSNKDGSVMVIQAEVPVDDEGLYEISEALFSWIKQFKPREFVVIDGVPVQDIPEKRQAFLVAGPERIRELAKKEIPTAEAALIAGFGGALLNESLMSGNNAIALLTHVSVQIPDPDAVLAIIDALNSIYGLGIQTEILEKSVEKIHEQIKQIAEEYKASQSPDSDSVDPMYR
ncbi:proteasome assembly chaperone family protein [Cuniculiplasma sp. SKW3]|uniref:proteasome assembly chaperone family protein n=1 Tax=unclassified Cuniculiplasma TaxID=2619706 RepID=UPI003FD08E82